MTIALSIVIGIAALLVMAVTYSSCVAAKRADEALDGVISNGEFLQDVPGSRSAHL
jgi:hypothetical protein